MCPTKVFSVQRLRYAKILLHLAESNLYVSGNYPWELFFFFFYCGYAKVPTMSKNSLFSNNFYKYRHFKPIRCYSKLKEKPPLHVFFKKLPTVLPMFILICIFQMVPCIFCDV